MRRSIALAIVGLTVWIPLTASGVSAAPKPKSYANCADMNRDFPKGVTNSRARVADAVRKGFLSPTVNDAVFNKNRRLSLSPIPIDSPAGVVCAVLIPVPPSGVKYLMGQSATDTSFQLFWMQPDVIGPAPLVYDVVVNGTKVTEGLTATSFTVSGLTPASTYAVQVIARNPVGQVATAVNVSTKAASAAPVAPAPIAPAPAGATRYSNCTDARAAGVTPIRRPSALYSANTHLDRDNDGIACE